MGQEAPWWKREIINWKFIAHCHLRNERCSLQPLMRDGQRQSAPFWVLVVESENTHTEESLWPLVNPGWLLEGQFLSTWCVLALHEALHLLWSIEEANSIDLECGLVVGWLGSNIGPHASQAVCSWICKLFKISLFQPIKRKIDGIYCIFVRRIKVLSRVTSL